MNNKAHLRPQDYDSNGDIIPMSMKEEKGDLISREALKKRLQDRHDFWVNAWGGFSDMPLNDKSRVDELSSCIAEVVNAPTVETDIEVVAKDAYEQGYTDGWKERFGEPDERPQGEWVAHEDMDEWYECNKCHCGNTYFDKLPRYCPNCGAKMKGGAE